MIFSSSILEKSQVNSAETKEDSEFDNTKIEKK